MFLTISPVRHSNRRYSSSIMKNRDLLHKYMVVSITTHTHVRRKSFGKKKGIEKTEERKGFYIMIQDHPVQCVKPKQALIALIWCGQYIWLLVYRDMAI